jgi:hypothetical protein
MRAEYGGMAEGDGTGKEPEVVPLGAAPWSAEPSMPTTSSSPTNAVMGTTPAPSDCARDLERAIVAATLAGRHATADLLADRLRERLAHDRGKVARLHPLKR